MPYVAASASAPPMVARSVARSFAGDTDHDCRHGHDAVVRSAHTGSQPVESLRYPLSTLASIRILPLAASVSHACQRCSPASIVAER
jgi:hypothetical protein